jgi:hypothetical protein
MEDNDNEYHLEISGHGAFRTSNRIIIELPTPALARTCCRYFQEITSSNKRPPRIWNNQFIFA